MPSEPIKQMFFAFIKEFLKSFESKKDTQVNVLQKFLEALRGSSLFQALILVTDIST